MDIDTVSLHRLALAIAGRPTEVTLVDWPCEERAEIIELLIESMIDILNPKIAGLELTADKMTITQSRRRKIECLRVKHYNTHSCQ